MAPSSIQIIEQYPAFILDKGVITPPYEDEGSRDAKQLVHDALKEHISGIDTDVCNAGEEDAFYVADMGEVYRQHLRWKKNLKRVKPHYGERFSRYE